MEKATGKFFTVLGLAAMAMAYGCGGSDSAVSGSSGSTTPNDPKIYEDSPYLALDGTQNQILMFNMDLTRRLSYFERLKDAVFSNEERKTWLEDLEKHVGFNPVKEVDRMVIGLKEPFDKEDWLKNAVIIMVGSYGNPESFAQGFVKFADGRYVNTPDPPFKNDYREVPIYSMLKSTSVENPDETLEYHLAFPSKRIVIFSRQLALITPVLDVIKGGQPNLQSKPDWQRRLAGARFSSVVMGMGEIPKTFQDWLKDKVQSDPEYKGLIFMGDAREFYFSYAYTGREYELSAALRCEDISRAQGLLSNVEEFRKRGLDRKAIEAWTEQDGARAAIWKRLVDQITISIRSEAVVLDLSKSTSEMDEFVEELIHPPAAPAPAAVVAPPAATDNADDPFN